MQLEGWKCLECGVVYTPFVKECRCVAKIKDNVDLSGVCFHNWPDTSSPCTKCGLRIGSGITFTIPSMEPIGCDHLYDNSRTTTAARICSKCGVQEVKWESPGTTCKVTVSDTPYIRSK